MLRQLLSLWVVLVPQRKSLYWNQVIILIILKQVEVTNVSMIVNDYMNMKPLPFKVIERTPNMYEDIDSSKDPEDYDLKRGILRTTHIGDIDVNLCSGTHLTNIIQIENILILLNQTNIKGSNSRLYFMRARRVRNYAQDTNKIINSIITFIEYLRSMER